MKTKKWITTSLAVAGGCLLAVTQANAAEVDSMTTDMSVGFGTETQTPGPIVPNSISLRSVPSNLSFGDDNIVETGTGIQAFDLQGLGTTRYVAVKDTRTGSNPWKVTAKASVLTDGSTSKFEGNNAAVIQFDSSAKAYHGNSAPGTGNNISDLTGQQGDPITSNYSVIIPTDDSSTTEVFKSALGGTPAGGWACELTNIKLAIPKGVAYEGAQYTGTITWSLEDTL